MAALRAEIAEVPYNATLSAVFIFRSDPAEMIFPAFLTVTTSEKRPFTHSA